MHVAAGLFLCYNQRKDSWEVGRFDRRGVNMRLDKFLKVSRVIKRRTVANEACDAGRVKINDKVAKASTDVKIGDIIEVQFGNRAVRIEVLGIQDTTKKEEAGELFKYL